jgi:tRNA-dihydrouridine synthase B
MAGISDLPFRQLCRRMGAGMAVSEMLTSDSRLWHTRKSQQRLNHGGETEPRSVQIAGTDAAMMARAAQLSVECGAQIIDINMGCPAKKVCKKAAGAALMKDPKMVAEILTAVVASVDAPVTLKIRTGWSPQQRNGIEIARIAEDCGISALAIHGRTRACGFNGEAEYHTIAEIKSAVSIPVIANGDIDSPHKALQVIQQTGADAVMIGRAAQGRPWLCRQIDQFLATGHIVDAPDDNAIKHILLEHLQALYAFYGEFMGVRIARKHVGWYLKDQNHSSFAPTEPTTAITATKATNHLRQQRYSADFRGHFNRLDSAHAQRQAIDDYFQQRLQAIYNTDHSDKFDRHCTINSHVMYTNNESSDVNYNYNANINNQEVHAA